MFPIESSSEAEIQFVFLTNWKYHKTIFITHKFYKWLKFMKEMLKIKLVFLLGWSVGRCWASLSSLSMCNSVVFPALSRPKKRSLPDFFHKPNHNMHSVSRFTRFLPWSVSSSSLLYELKVCGIKSISFSSTSCFIKVALPECDSPRNMYFLFLFIKPTE